MSCPCTDPKCTHHRPINGNTCREFAQQAAGSDTLQASGLCLHCHNAHNTTVVYHSADWDVLVSCGWLTHSVDNNNVATMFKPHASIPFTDSEVQS